MEAKKFIYVSAPVSFKTKSEQEEYYEQEKKRWIEGYENRKNGVYKTTLSVKKV